MGKWVLNLEGQYDDEHQTEVVEGLLKTFHELATATYAKGTFYTDTQGNHSLPVVEPPPAPEPRV